jgi:hypothetical protein
VLSPRRKIVALAVSAMVAGATIAATETSASGAQDTAITSIKPGTPITKEQFSIRGSLATEVARPVNLQRRTSSGWKTIKESTSTGTGRFSFTTATSGDKTYRVHAPQAMVGEKTYRARTTAKRTVKPVSQTAKVTLSTTRVRVGSNKLDIVGAFTPVRKGRAVVLYFQKKGTPATAFAFTQNSNGKFRHHPGTPPEEAKGTHYVWVKTLAADGAPSKTSKKASFKVVD